MYKFFISSLIFFFFFLLKFYMSTSRGWDVHNPSRNIFAVTCVRVFLIIFSVLYFILTVSHSLCVCLSLLLLSLSLFLSLFVSFILLIFLFSCLYLSICLSLSICLCRSVCVSPLSYRAIGDVTLQPYVTCHPEILQRVIGPEDEYLLLASDGLWVRQKFQPSIIWLYFFLFLLYIFFVWVDEVSHWISLSIL